VEIRNLGRSGLRVSAIGLGCNNFGSRIDLEATRKVIHQALDLGITLFDTADVYGDAGGSETAMVDGMAVVTVVWVPPPALAVWTISSGA